MKGNLLSLLKAKSTVSPTLDHALEFHDRRGTDADFENPVDSKRTEKVLSSLSSLGDLVKAREKVKRRLEPMLTGLDPGTETPMLSSQVSHEPTIQPKSYDSYPPPSESSNGATKAKKRAWIIRIGHPFRIKWDLFVMMLAAWNIFTTPYFIAFKPDSSDDTSLLVINTFIDCLFITDIYLNFRTTFYTSSTGDEIFHLPSIAKNYAFGKLWLDILASIPSDLLKVMLIKEDDNSFGISTALALFGMIKLSRVSRLNRIINFLRTRNDVKMLLRIGQLIFFLLMYLHLLACAWWIIANYDHSWLGAQREDIYDAPVEMQYWICFYNSVFFLVGGEVLPRTAIQAGLAGFLMLSGAIITAVMFGDMALLMSSLNMRTTKFQENQNAVNTAMKNMRLPELLQQTISDYLIYTEASIASRNEIDTFRALISPSLYRQVLLHIYDTIIKQNDVFGPHQHIAEFVLPKLKPRFCKPEELVIMQGEIDIQPSMYFIASGDCDVYVKDERKRDKFVTLLRPGSHFGEVALLTGVSRSASVLSLNYCTLAMLDYQDFCSLIKNFPQCITVFKQGMFAYNDRYKRFLVRTLTRVPFFRKLNWKTEQELIYSTKQLTIDEGEYLARPGQASELIYFLIDGAIEVSITINDKALARKRTQIYGLQKVEFSHQHTWNLSKMGQQTRLKRFTEIYPLKGNTGIEGSLHATELDSEKGIKHILGNYCVELALDTLGSGSSFGFFTMIAGEHFSIQAKAIERCNLFALDRATLVRFRKTHHDLHESLSKYETWCKHNTPHIDDYIASNDELPGYQYEINSMRGLNRLRGAALRVIKEKRDLRLLEIPTLATMLKSLGFKPRHAMMKARANDKLNKEIFSRMFFPKKTEAQSKDKMLRELSELTSKLSRHSTLLRTLSTQANLKQIPVSPKPPLVIGVAVQTDDTELRSQDSIPILDEYVTVPFIPS